MQGSQPEGEQVSDESRKSYAEIGRYLRRVAFDRGVEGPYVIARHLRRWAEESEWPEKLPVEPTIAKYLNGTREPSRPFVRLYIAAFEMSEDEVTELSRLYMGIPRDPKEAAPLAA